MKSRDHDYYYSYSSSDDEVSNSKPESNVSPLLIDEKSEAEKVTKPIEEKHSLEFIPLDSSPDKDESSQLFATYESIDINKIFTEGDTSFFQDIANSSSLKSILISKTDDKLNIFKSIENKRIEFILSLFQYFNEQDQYEIFKYSIQTSNIEVFEALIANPMKNKQKDHNGKPFIHFAYESGSMNIFELLVTKYDMIHVKDKNNETIIFTVIRDENIDEIKFLLNHGSSITNVNNQIRTPFSYAVELKNSKVAIQIINLVNIEIFNNEDIKSSIITCIEQRKIDIIKALHDINFRSMSFRAVKIPLLCQFLIENDDENAELLIDMAITIDTPMMDGETPLILAANKGKYEFVKKLIDLKVDLYVENKFGNAYINAIISDNPEIASLLHINYTDKKSIARFLVKCAIQKDITNFMKFFNVESYRRIVSIKDMIPFKDEIWSEWVKCKENRFFPALICRYGFSIDRRIIDDSNFDVFSEWEISRVYKVLALRDYSVLYRYLTAKPIYSDDKPKNEQFPVYLEELPKKEDNAKNMKNIDEKPKDSEDNEKQKDSEVKEEKPKDSEVEEEKSKDSEDDEKPKDSEVEEEKPKDSEVEEEKPKDSEVDEKSTESEVDEKFTESEGDEKSIESEGDEKSTESEVDDEKPKDTDDEEHQKFLEGYKDESTMPEICLNHNCYVAIRKGNIQKALKYIESGAYKNIKDFEKDDIFKYAVKHYELQDFCKMLVDNGMTQIVYNSSKTCVMLCAIYDCYDLLLYLIQKKFDVNINENTSNKTALHYSSMRGFGKITSLLCDLSDSIDERDCNGNTPLLLAVMNSKIESLKVLIEKGANINTRNNKNLTPIIVAGLNRNIEICKVLFNNGASLNEMYTFINENPDIYTGNELYAFAGAFSQFNFGELKNLAPSIILQVFENSTDDQVKKIIRDTNKNVLLIAMKTQNINLVLKLLRFGADPYSIDENGINALMRACQSTKFNIFIEELMKIDDSKINLQNKEGMTALHFAAINKNRDIVHLLLKHNADVLLPGKNKYTPLMFACESGDKHVVKMIAKKMKKKEINLINAFHETALFIACLSNNPLIAIHLIEHGADVEISNENGVTPFMISCTFSSKFLYSYLRRIANIYRKDNSGNTALMYATYGGNNKIIKSIKKRTDFMIHKNTSGVEPDDILKMAILPENIRPKDTH